jgi:hypothetical protein
VLNNDHHLTDHHALSTRANTHEYNPESGPTFAMQSEDFPALPGSQVAAIPLSNDDECVPTDGASSVVLQDIAPQGSIHTDSRTKLPRDCDTPANQGAILRGIALSSTPNTDSISSIPHNLREYCEEKLFVNKMIKSQKQTNLLLRPWPPRLYHQTLVPPRLLSLAALFQPLLSIVSMGRSSLL